MGIKFDVYSTITLFGIFHGFVMGIILLFIKRGNRRANVILSVFLFVISASVFIYFILESTNLYYYLPHLTGFSLPLLFLYGPLLYFYVNTLTIPGYRIKRKSFLHFIPAPTCLLCMLPFYLRNAEYKISYLATYPRNIIVFDSFTLLWFSAIVYIFVYIVISKKVLYRYTTSIKQIFSNIDTINFKWFRLFITIFSIVWYLIIIITIVDFFIYKIHFLNKIIPILVTIGIFLFGYLGLTQSDVTGNPAFRESDKKYRKSAINHQKAHEYMQDVVRFMVNEKPYLDPDLTLPSLAERLKMNRNDLSQVINTAAGQNFYDFVNTYRIKEVMRLMRDPEKKHLTFFALALEAGFNSKATFNIAFKKRTAKTPREYLNEKREAVSSQAK